MVSPPVPHQLQLTDVHIVAASLGLLEEHSPNNQLTVMIQALNRFLLDKISADYRQMSPQSSHMDSVSC